MAQLSPEVKLRVAKKELTLVEALTEAGLDVPEWLRTGASAPAPAPVAPGEVEISATGADPKTQEQPGDLAAQAVETVAESVAESAGRPEGGQAGRGAAQAGADAAPAVRAEAARRQARDQPGGRAARGGRGPGGIGQR